MMVAVMKQVGYTSVAMICSVLFIAGCSTNQTNYKGVYDVELENHSLEVPPDLTKPETSTLNDLPDAAKSALTYTDYQQTKKTNPGQLIASSSNNMRFVRDGSVFWLEVKAKPDQVWEEVREFLPKVGFELKLEQPQLGIIETNWLENRIGIPTNWFAKLFKKVFATGLLDKYRVRIERGADAETSLVFVTHQGLKEFIEGATQSAIAVEGSSTNWTVRESDPELETELLMRFMVQRGVSEETAKLTIASGAKRERTQLKQQDGQTSLQINEPFARSWRLAEIALDRLGFVIEDRNRSTGTYYIRVPESFLIESAKGWLFSTKENKPSTDKYLLVLEDKGDMTMVQVRQREAKTEDLPLVSKKILAQIQGNIL
jgi:outer membrane protein assembly factor BamC